MVVKVLKGKSGAGSLGLRDFGQSEDGAEVLSVHQAGKPDGPAFCMKYEAQLLAVNIIEVAFMPQNEMTATQMKRVGTFESSIFAHHVRHCLPPASLVNGVAVGRGFGVGAGRGVGVGGAAGRGGAFGRGQAPAVSVAGRGLGLSRLVLKNPVLNIVKAQHSVPGAAAGQYADAESQAETPVKSVKSVKAVKSVRRKGLRSGKEAERVLEEEEREEEEVQREIASAETSVRGMLAQDVMTAGWMEWMPWETVGGDVVLKGHFEAKDMVRGLGKTVACGDLVQLKKTPYGKLDGKLVYVEEMFEYDAPGQNGVVMLARLALRADELTETRVRGSGSEVAAWCRSMNEGLFLHDVDIGSALRRKFGVGLSETPAILLPLVLLDWCFLVFWPMPRPRRCPVVLGLTLCARS